MSLQILNWFTASQVSLKTMQACSPTQLFVALFKSEYLPIGFSHDRLFCFINCLPVNLPFSTCFNECVWDGCSDKKSRVSTLAFNSLKLIVVLNVWAMLIDVN